jgi:hypothetical protein
MTLPPAGDRVGTMRASWRPAAPSSRSYSGEVRARLGRSVSIRCAEAQDHTVAPLPSADLASVAVMIPRSSSPSV